MKKFFSSDKRWLIAAIICVVVIWFGFYCYSNISTAPVRKAFDNAFIYYLTGDCDKYSQLYNVSFSKEFLDKYDYEWQAEASYQKREAKADKCREKTGHFLDVKIKNVSREKFSDTAFIQAEVITVNDSGVHHIVPQSFVMKKIGNNWLINVFCDTESDLDCK